MINFVKAHPVLTYYALAFALSWAALLAVIGPSAFVGAEVIPEDILPLVYPAILTGPGIAGVFLTGLIDGRTGLRSLGSRMLKWRVSVRWYVVALLTAPLLAMATLLVLAPVSTDFIPSIFTESDRVSIVLIGIAVGLGVGLIEELGWTGFVIPRMRLSHGVLATGLTMGLAWGVWHLPLFTGSSNSSGSLPPVLYVFILAFSFLPAYRVLMVWVYEHTQSVFLAILMHAPLVAIQFALIPASLSGAAMVAFDLLFAALIWLLVVVIRMVEHGHLPRRTPAAHPA